MCINMHHIFFININDDRQLLYINNGKISQKKLFLKSHER